MDEAERLTTEGLGAGDPGRDIIITSSLRHLKSLPTGNTVGPFYLDLGNLCIKGAISGPDYNFSPKPPYVGRFLWSQCCPQ